MNWAKKVSNNTQNRRNVTRLKPGVKFANPSRTT